jgi:hypothetical protein
MALNLKTDLVAAQFAVPVTTYCYSEHHPDQQKYKSITGNIGTQFQSEDF